MNNVLTIIVTYNRASLLNECLEALIDSSYASDILVVDNNSSDNTKEIASINKSKANEKNIEIIYENTLSNLGGAGGYNFGLKYASNIVLNNTSKYKYFYLMDDDTVVTKDALKVLIDFSHEINDNFGFLSSKVLWTDGNICKTNVQRLKVARKICDFESRVVEVDYASFVSVLFQAKDVLEKGLPIKDFFIWTDDLEYTRRFSYMKKSYLLNDSIVIHKCKGNYGVDITKELPERIDRYKYIYRNDYYTFKREGIYGYFFLWIRFFYHILKVIFCSKNKLSKIKTIIKGYIDGLSFNPKVEYVKKN